VIDAVVRPLADAFLQVGVYVAVLVAGFGFLQLRFGDRMTDYLARHGRLGVLVAALLGVSPGCGGAILVMPLYVRGKLSFGAVVAALTATMGDSSWIVIAADPGFALRIHALLFAVGLVSGYVVDLLGIKPRRRSPARASESVSVAAESGSAPVARSASADNARSSDRNVCSSASNVHPSGSSVCASGPAAADVSASPSAAADVPTSSSAADPGPRGGSRGDSGLSAAGCGTARLAGRRGGGTAAAFWGVTTPAFLVSVPVVFHLVDPAVLRPETLGGLDLYLAFGVAGTAVALLILVVRGFRAPSAHSADAPSGVKGVLRRSADEASFITFWVAVAYLGWEAVSRLSGFDGSGLMLTGISGIVAAALIGLVPGCAVQIVFTGVYVAGGLPLPALVANAVSQDGDALIPLAALDRRAALLAAVVTTVPALLTGFAALATGL